MKISYNWVKELMPLEVSLEKASEKLTVIGLEVEGLEEYISVKGGLEGVVVGKVLTCVKHPDADKLSITSVDLGDDEPVQIVCGAPNISAGQTVAVATVGCMLYPKGEEGFKIKKAKIRGAVSLGMICAEDELGLSQSHDGIMVLSDELSAGTPMSDVVEISKDQIFDIGLTPNRGDAQSHRGVARDLLAAIRAEEGLTGNLTVQEFTSIKTGQIEDWKVEVENDQACPRYSAIVIEDLIVKESPAWLKNRLVSLGVNSINNIVDITNWVMLEMGQPLHAFDADRIVDQTVKVGFVKNKTKFVSLDNTERNLRSDDLMIKGGDDKGLCIAGVFGGKHSETQMETQSIFLESAFFDPKYIRSTSMHHNFRTSAATIYEKHADPALTVKALERAVYLIQKLAGGKVKEGLIDLYPNKIEDAEVQLRLNRVNLVLGTELTKDNVENILEALEIEIVNFTDGVWDLRVPSYRSDVQREVDVIEEVIRIFGLDNIPLPKHLKSSIDHSSGSTNHIVRRNIGQKLNGLGFSEMMNVSLTKDVFYPERRDLIGINNTSNSVLNIMRPDLLHPALESVKYNLNRQQKDLKFFEFGRVYSFVDEEIVEKEHLILIMTGQRYKKSWMNSEQFVQSHDVSGIAQNLLELSGLKFDISEPKENNSWSEESFIFINGESILAEGGLVNKSTLKMHEINEEIAVVIIDMSSIFKKIKKKKIVYQEVSKYPTVERHLAIRIKNNVKFNDIQGVIRKRGKSLVSEIDLFDVYRDEQMILDKEKSYAISILFSKVDRTLKDKEIDKIINSILGDLERDFSAIIRK